MTCTSISRCPARSSLCKPSRVSHHSSFMINSSRRLEKKRTIGETGRHVDTIHPINLDRSTGRLAKFNRRNLHLANVVRFPAVDGAQ